MRYLRWTDGVAAILFVGLLLPLPLKEGAVNLSITLLVIGGIFERDEAEAPKRRADAEAFLDALALAQRERDDEARVRAHKARRGVRKQRGAKD